MDNRHINLNDAALATVRVFKNRIMFVQFELVIHIASETAGAIT